MIKRTTIFCLLTLAISTAFKSASRSTNASDIVGTYHGKIAFLHDQTETELRIKKDFQYEQISNSSGNNYKSTITINGKWSLSNDTLLLIPIKLKSKKKSATSSQTQSNESVNCNGNADVPFCKTDTLVYKNNELWTVRSPIYKLYTRK